MAAGVDRTHDAQITPEELTFRPQVGWPRGVHELEIRLRDTAVGGATTFAAWSFTVVDTFDEDSDLVPGSVEPGACFGENVNIDYDGWCENGDYNPVLGLGDTFYDAIDYVFRQGAPRLPR